jgi:phage gp29-like protein
MAVTKKGTRRRYNKKHDYKKERQFSEVGVGGTKVFSGTIEEEFIPELRGEKGRKVFRQMSDNDATISALLFGIEMLVRATEWRIEPNSLLKQKEVDEEPTEEELEKAHWLRGVLFEDMEHSWDDFISDAMTMLIYGWSYHEIVYKYRRHEDGSSFDDGMIGIKKIATRPQETLEDWVLAPNGDVLAMRQRDPNTQKIFVVPYEKSLLFRARRHKNSPEGKSILRNAYRSWYFMKNVEEIEAIAIERELNGLPVCYIPQEIFDEAEMEDGDASKLNAYIELVRDIKFNEQGGVVLPSDPWVDQDGRMTTMKKVELTLLTTNGQRSIDTNRTILRYQHDIARTVLADFLMLGSGERGSFALSRTKVDLFLRALKGWLEAISTVINKELVPRLWKLNGLSIDIMPKVIPGSVAPEDLLEIGDLIKKLAEAGMPLFPDPNLEKHLRHVAGLPEKDTNMADILEEMGLYGVIQPYLPKEPPETQETPGGGNNGSSANPANGNRTATSR